MYTHISLRHKFNKSMRVGINVKKRNAIGT